MDGTASMQVVPALLAEIARLRAENEKLRALLLRSRDLFHWARIHSDLVDDIDAALAAGGE